jgi:hypothetical protein
VQKSGRFAVTAQFLGALFQRGRSGGRVFPAAHIAAGAKGAACAGEHDRANVRVIRCGYHRLMQLLMQLGRQGVELIRPVQREYQDSAVALDSQRPVRGATDTDIGN